jgi:hypothetical protein
VRPFYSFNFLAAAVFAIFFYRAGELESSPGLLWSALSAVISLLICQWLRWGLSAMIFGQIALLAGIAVFRSHRKP